MQDSRRVYPAPLLLIARAFSLASPSTLPLILATPRGNERRVSRQRDVNRIRGGIRRRMRGSGGSASYPRRRRRCGSRSLVFPYRWRRGRNSRERNEQETLSRRECYVRFNPLPAVVALKRYSVQVDANSSIFFPHQTAKCCRPYYLS